MREPIAILLVDDDEEDYMLTRDIIERVNHQRYTVDWVDNYEKAREVIARQEHDVYLIDYRLGAMSGLELLREFVEKGCECPMILLTGQGDIEVDAQAMKAGASDYLIKSQLNTDQFERSIRYALQQSNNLREIRSFNTDLEARVEKRTQALRQAVLDLRQSQQLYNSIAANFPSGFLLVLNRDYRLELADGSEIGVLGARYKGNLAGEVITDIISEHERQALEPFLNHTFEGASSTCELPLGEFIFSFRGVPLLDPNGNISRILVVCNNITPQKQAEAEVHNALLKERQLNELKSRFISMASHEFRTPLGTILSSASLIARYAKPDDEEKRQKHIDRIQGNVRNLTNILDDFLSLSKLEEGKIEVESVCFDATSFCRDISEEMQGQARKGQEIVFSQEGSSDIQADKKLLRNVLLNLLSNAVKYSPEDTRIFLRLFVRSQEVLIEVEDQGIGIPKEEQAHLFERFYRAKNATHIQGTGLGLNILQKYVALMEGQVEFRSEVGKGTLFRVTLPQ